MESRSPKRLKKTTVEEKQRHALRQLVAWRKLGFDATLRNITRARTEAERDVLVDALRWVRHWDDMVLLESFKGKANENELFVKYLFGEALDRPGAVEHETGECTVARRRSVVDDDEEDDGDFHPDE